MLKIYFVLRVYLNFSENVIFKHVFTRGVKRPRAAARQSVRPSVHMH